MRTRGTFRGSLVLLTALLAGCGSEQKKWSEAQAANTVQAYEAFLEHHPSGAFSVSARSALETVRYEDATKTNTVGAYRAFLDRHPDGKLSESARSKIQLLNLHQIDATTFITSASAKLEKLDYGDRRWTVRVKITNPTSYHAQVGRSLFLMEAAQDESAHLGVARVWGEEPEAALSSTSWEVPASNYRVLDYEVTYRSGQTLHRRGSNVMVISGGSKEAPWPDTLSAGQTADFNVELDQRHEITNAVDESVRLVLPEIAVRDGAQVRRFRPVVLLTAPSASGTRTIAHQDVVEIEKTDLVRLLEARDIAMSLRIFAANWLSQLDPSLAQETLGRVAAPLEDGDLLFTCISLLKTLNGDALASKAVAILQNQQSPVGMRQIAADYLGAIRYVPGRVALEAAAKDRNEAVAGTARRALTALAGAATR